MLKKANDRSESHDPSGDHSNSNGFRDQNHGDKGYRHKAEPDRTVREQAVHDKRKPCDEVACPCVRHCCLGDDDVCLGCFRSLDEIKGWHQADSPTRLLILENTVKRRQQHQQRYPSFGLVR